MSLEEKVYNIIDLFEDFLEERGVRIPSSDKEMKEDDNFVGNAARIYGTDYTELEDAIREIVK